MPADYPEPRTTSSGGGTYTAPHSGPGGGPVTVSAGRGSRATPPPSKTIHNFDDLKKIYPNYKSASMNQLLIDLTNTGYMIDPAFYRDLQDFLLATEQASGHPVAEIAQLEGIFPAAARGDISPPNLDTSGGGGGGGGGRAAAMTAEQELDLYRQKAELDAQIRAQEDARQNEFNAQQKELDRQAQLRLQRLSDLSGLVGQFAGLQSKARETLAGLQGDPFRFAAAKLGLQPAGVTPTEAFSAETRNFANQPLPQVGANAPLSDIEAAIQRLQGLSAPQAPSGVMGFAEGGSVSGATQRVLVGERGPEVVEGSDFRVMPLTASGAAGYDPSTLLPALSPLYSGLGFGKFPIASQQTGGFQILNSGGRSAGSLGYHPGLINVGGAGGQTYYRGADDVLHQFMSPQSFAGGGFNYGDVLQIDPRELAGFGSVGAAYNPQMSATAPGQRPNAFSSLSTPIIEPVTGAMLPAPFRAATMLNYLKHTNPGFYALALSAYGNAVSRAGGFDTLAGYNQANVEAEMQQALPTGQSHGLIGLR
jgi:hypothetical protein